MSKPKTKKLELTKDEIDELLQIIYDCQSHLQDYDMEDEECPYYETYSNCDKWSDKLERLQK